MQHPFLKVEQLLNPTPQPQYYEVPMDYGWLAASPPSATEGSMSPGFYKTPMNPPSFKGFASTSASKQPIEYELPRKRVKPNPALPIRGKSTSASKHGTPHESKYKRPSSQSSTPRSQRPKPNLIVEFTDVAAHTAKCDQCNGRNKDGMTRCCACGWQCCRKCLTNRGGNRTHPSFTSTHIPADEPGLSITRRNAANASASASASVSAAATAQNTPCPVRNGKSQVNSSSVSSVVKSAASPTPAQRPGSTVVSSIVMHARPVSEREPVAPRPASAGATPEAKAAILLMDLSSDSSLSSTGAAEGSGSTTKQERGAGGMDNQDSMLWSADDMDFPIGEEFDNVRRNPSRRARPIDMKE
ncbi:Nucleic acid-binding OB-fold [Penicillium herquei]|nr:Nucleic acid-binding OB-fold [Penicillium herquei]